MYREEEIVWAKMDGQPWWPAKITKLNRKEKVTVLFFEEDAKYYLVTYRARLELSAICKYKEGKPEFRKAGKSNLELARAIQLADKYYRTHDQGENKMEPAGADTQKQKLEEQAEQQNSPPAVYYATERRTLARSLCQPKKEPVGNTKIYTSGCAPFVKAEQKQNQENQTNIRNRRGQFTVKRSSLERQKRTHVRNYRDEMWICSRNEKGQFTKEVSSSTRPSCRPTATKILRKFNRLIKMDKLTHGLTAREGQIAIKLVGLLSCYVGHSEILELIFKQESEWNQALSINRRSEVRNVFENYERGELTDVKKYLRSRSSVDLKEVDIQPEVQCIESPHQAVSYKVEELSQE